MCRFKFAIVDLKLHTFLHILHFAIPGLSVRLKCAQMGLLFILFGAITKTINKTHKYNPQNLQTNIKCLMQVFLKRMLTENLYNSDANAHA